MERDDLIPEGVALGLAIFSALEKALPDIGAAPKQSRKDIALIRWMQYLVVLTLELGHASLDLAEKRHPRAMTVVNRSIFEYVTKAEYFFSDQDLALEQYSTVEVRNYAFMSRLNIRDEAAREGVLQRLKQWDDKHKSLNEFSGKKKLHKMHLATVKPELIKRDPRRAKGADAYTPRYEAMHDVPSKIVHGEPDMMVDVIPWLADESNFAVRMTSGRFQVYRELQKTIIYGMDLLRLLMKHYGIRIPHTLELVARVREYEAKH